MDGPAGVRKDEGRVEGHGVAGDIPLRTGAVVVANDDNLGKVTAVLDEALRSLKGDEFVHGVAAGAHGGAEARRAKGEAGGAQVLGVGFQVRSSGRVGVPGGLPVGCHGGAVTECCCDGRKIQRTTTRYRTMKEVQVDVGGSSHPTGWWCWNSIESSSYDVSLSRTRVARCRIHRPSFVGVKKSYSLLRSVHC